MINTFYMYCFYYLCIKSFRWTLSFQYHIFFALYTWTFEVWSNFQYLVFSNSSRIFLLQKKKNWLRSECLNLHEKVLDRGWLQKFHWFFFSLFFSYFQKLRVTTRSEFKLSRFEEVGGDVTDFPTASLTFTNLDFFYLSFLALST